MLFCHLSPARETEFRKWARDNYRRFDPISGVWHPVVQDECRKINEESGYAPDDYNPPGPWDSEIAWWNRLCAESFNQVK